MEVADKASLPATDFPMIAVAPSFQPVCEDYAIACAVPVDAPGWETYIGPCWVDQVQRQNFENVLH